MSLETRAFAITERGSERNHVRDSRLCRVAKGTPPSIESVRQLDVRAGSSPCHVNESVRSDSGNVSVETAPLDIIGANGTEKAQDSLGETIVSFISFGAVLAGNELEEGHV
jgi:hypothetical protein